MKENITLFLTHYDDYLDICLSLNTDQHFENIRQLKLKLKSKWKLITLEEYNKEEADIFYEYLKLIGVTS
jgi:hypothetical protein